MIGFTQVKTKDDSVNLSFHSYMNEAVKITAHLLERDLGYEAIITSGKDGKHSENSLHYEGRAADFRTWTSPTSGKQISQQEKLSIVENIHNVLNAHFYGRAVFDVIAESTHIHVELDTIYG